MVVESKVFFKMSTGDMICFVVLMLQNKDSAEVKKLMLNGLWSIRKSLSSV